MSCLSHVAHGLEPSERMFDDLPDDLAHGVARMPCRACVDCTRAPSDVLRDVRYHAEFTPLPDERAAVVAFVGGDGHAVLARNVRQQTDRRLSLRGACRLRNFTANDETIAILDGHMAHVHELRFRAERLAEEARIRIRRGLM